MCPLVCFYILRSLSHFNRHLPWSLNQRSCPTYPSLVGSPATCLCKAIHHLQEAFQLHCHIKSLPLCCCPTYRVINEVTPWVTTMALLCHPAVARGTRKSMDAPWAHMTSSFRMNASVIWAINAQAISGHHPSVKLH
jgi:hypothetical protein